MNLFRKLEEIRSEIADRRYFKRVFRDSMKDMSFPYKLKAIQILRNLAKESKAAEAEARAPKEKQLAPDMWEHSPEYAEFPNLYAEIALRVCGGPEDYAKAAGVTVEHLYNAVYGGWDDLTEQQKEAIAQWAEKVSGGMVSKDYLFAPGFSVYYTMNRKHGHKLQNLSAKFNRVKALAKKYDREQAEKMASVFGNELESKGFMQHVWISRAYYNKVLMYLESVRTVLAVKVAMDYAENGI